MRGFSLLAVAVLAACDPVAAPSVRSCNGSPANCARRYDDVCIAATHNAYAYAEGGPVAYSFPNQDRPIADQLAAGIRGLGLRPVPYFGDDPAKRDLVYVTHNPDLLGALGTEPLVDVLEPVAAFLAAHPDEVVTVYSESSVALAKVSAVVEAAGLASQAVVHPADEPWPTLDALVDAGTRLVWFELRADPDQPAWMLPMFDHLVDTDYDARTTDDLGCGYHRGRSGNRLYFLNNFLYADLGGGLLTPDAGLAAAANDRAFVEARAARCRGETGRFPNVVYVDFFGRGDVVGAVNAINDWER